MIPYIYKTVIQRDNKNAFPSTIMNRKQNTRLMDGLVIYEGIAPKKNKQFR